MSLKTSFDQDGHLTAATTVDLELSVNAWEATDFAVMDGTLKFGVCIQADIMLVNAELESILMERKHFNFLVSPILSTFTISSVIDDGTVVVDNSENELSGTDVDSFWRSANPLPPGEPIWFELSVINEKYDFVQFETVIMKIGDQGTPINLIADSDIVDSALTSIELGNTPKTIHFYHFLPRSAFGSTTQTLTLTGKALVSYVGGARRLRGTEDRELASTDLEKTNFEVKVLMMADASDDSGSFTVEVLSIVIGGIGAIGAAMF